MSLIFTAKPPYNKTKLYAFSKERERGGEKREREEAGGLTFKLPPLDPRWSLHVISRVFNLKLGLSDFKEYIYRRKAEIKTLNMNTASSKYHA